MPNDHEEWFDENIAPVLLELANKCKERGIPFVAGVQFGPSEHNFSLTQFLPADASLRMVMLRHCAKMGTNIDGYVMGLKRYADENNIDTGASMVMQMFRR